MKDLVIFLSTAGLGKDAGLILTDLILVLVRALYPEELLEHMEAPWGDIVGIEELEVHLDHLVHSPVSDYPRA